MHSVVIFCAQYLILLICLLAAIYWLTVPKQQKLQLIVYGFVTAVIALLLAKIGSALFYDTRPFVGSHVVPLVAHSSDNGFPSDHTLLSAAVAVTIYSASKKWGAGLIVLALVVGVARVAAHVHHPIDIIGSLVFVGFGSLAAHHLVPRITARIFK